jgi:hypothetical protein
MSTPNGARRRISPKTDAPTRRPTLVEAPRTPAEIAESHLRAETEFVAMRLRGAAQVLGIWLTADNHGGPVIEDEVSLFVSGALEALAGTLDAAREAVWEAEHPGRVHPDRVDRASA